MQRRSFLSVILTAGTAPVIVRADRLMKLWVPKQPPWYLPAGLLENETPFLSVVDNSNDLVLAKMDPLTGAVLRELRGLSLLEFQDAENFKRGIVRLPSDFHGPLSIQFSFDYKVADWKPDTGATSATA